MLYHWLRRIGIAFPDRRHVGEPEKLAIGKQIDAFQIIDRIERSGDADRVFPCRDLLEDHLTGGIDGLGCDDVAPRVFKPYG